MLPDGRFKPNTGIAGRLTSIDREGCISVVLQQKKSCIAKSNGNLRISSRRKDQGSFMKEVAILLLVALMLNGCGSSSSKTTQATATGVWSADLSGGIGPASGFSFTTQFTVNGNGTLNITYFQFLTSGTCFPITGGSQSGSMVLTTNTTTNAVTGTFVYAVQSGGNTLTLNGTVTGTVAMNTTTFSGGAASGTWSVTGGTGCNVNGQSFTMTQTS
jgi:hypothetical protein